MSIFPIVASFAMMLSCGAGTALPISYETANVIASPASASDSSSVNVSAVITAKGKVKLTWDKVPGASKYAVYRKNGGKMKKVRETEKTSATIRTDKNDKGYAVKAYIDGKWTTIAPGDIIVPVYSEKQLVNMAKKYYKAENGYEPPVCEVDSRDGHMVMLHLYEDVSDGDMGGHAATYAWYTVDDRTGKGIEEIFGEEIDLTKTS